MMSEAPFPTVSNFIWLGDRFVETLDLEPAGVRRHRLSEASGQFSIQQRTAAGEHVLARDRLGVNKLFFAIDGEGGVHTSNYRFDLARRGFSPEAIWSVPSGHVVTIDPAERMLALEKYADLAFNEDPTESARPTAYAGQIRERLTAVFRSLAPVVGRRPLYVSLSGGLDSATVGALAREFVGEFTAVTFAVDTGRSGLHSEDLHYAARLAAHLGVRFEPVVLTRAQILSLLDTALIYGQDWRDFNVHCALVNAAVGAAIRDRHAASASAAAPVLLTGDVMNELMADYTAVWYNGREYYRLPRLSPGRLRRFLVSGLDAGDREVGVFKHFGVDVVQPYALCAEVYASLPASFIESPQAKQRLVREVMGDRIPDYIYDRPKTRAQAGGADEITGTLAVLADAGIDAAALEQRFSTLFSTDRARMRQWIRAGFYRFTSSYPTGVTHAALDA
jgi:asparagine synthetase B (glutamine-hydrolysing)